MTATNDTWQQLPADLRGMVEAQLAGGETPLIWLEPDLDARLRYARGLLVLTDRRLIAVGPAELAETAGRGGRAALPFYDWPLAMIESLRAKEQAGVGALDLRGAESLLAQWRYTIGQSSQAHRLVDWFERMRKGELSGGQEGAEPPTTVCPSCGAILAADQKSCPDCGEVKGTPSVGSLYRLIGFAKSRKWTVLLGFGLMVASTCASLVPTYLTIPLIDNVLKPAERHETVAFSQAWWYLLGFVGASLLTWLLTWARTFVLARVSERIAVDMRNQTYSHMQRLSLEFFGGKRTGDLIARVSTDTDRICYFLSVYVLDFANDVLTILLVAAFLVSLDPMLAIVTLLPLPVIAYLVHRVREPVTRRFCPGHAGVERDDQCIGRHDSRHSGCQGICPRGTGDRSLSRSQRSRAAGQRSREYHLDFF